MDQEVNVRGMHRSRQFFGWVRGVAAVTLLSASSLAPVSAAPSVPEPVSIRELPLPPTAPSATPGSCTRQVNPHGTGCMSASEYGTSEGPSYTWDGHHVLLTVIFEGAPAAQDPASIYSGVQVIAIKTDGSHFPNGDAWKCLTCGVPDANALGINREVPNPMLAGFGLRGSKPPVFDHPQPLFDHPQPFHDGKRVLVGTNILDCGPYKVTDMACTPQRVHIYPISWHGTVDEKGAGVRMSMRELRLNPDDVHIGWNSFVPPPRFDQFGLFGRLVFNRAPKSGTPRYDVENVYVMVNSAPEYANFVPDPANPGYLLHNVTRGAIGEFRGFSSDGKSAVGMGMEESGNMDLYLTSLQTEQSKRITSDPSYTDPSKMSPDDHWVVYMNPRQSDRHMYYAALQGIPPLMDMLTIPMSTCCYNNGNRRFFQPYLLAVDDPHEGNPGQQLNAGPGTPDSPSDPNWNGRADPTWSPDGTHVVYWQALVTTPACGGDSALPCPVSTEPGGRRTRLMMATLTSRKPGALRTVKPVSDVVPWGVALHAGDPAPMRAHFQPGKYILKGKVSGQADVEFVGKGDAVVSISARYSNYSDDGRHIINGTESAEHGSGLGQVVVHSDIKASGAQNGTKVSSEPGGFVIGWQGPVSGTLTTTIDGRAYTPPMKWM